MPTLFFSIQKLRKLEGATVMSNKTCVGAHWSKSLRKIGGKIQQSEICVKFA